MIFSWLCSFSYAQEPKDALESYFKALELSDRDILRSSIHAPDYYKDSFVKVIDVKNGFTIIEGLIAKKYGTKNVERKSMNKYTSSLNKDLLKRDFKINGETAISIPLNDKEVPVLLKKVKNKWLLDLQRNQSEESLKQQAELIDASYEAVLAMLRGLISKIDTLDTKKYTYDEAMTMVGIQVNQALDRAIKQKK